MKTLVEKLKRDHAELLGRLEAFRSGQGISGRQWKENLFAAKKLFEDHLREEDEKLYPVLLKHADRDPVLKNITERFVREMRSVTEQTRAFFAKYSDSSSGTVFMQEYAALLTRLKTRMEEEEKDLFRIFEESGTVS